MMKAADDEKLREEQAGLRKNGSTIDQIATLMIIVEPSIEWKSSLLVNFTDYQKTFDSVGIATLWKIMRHYRIPDELANRVGEMYEGLCCRILHEGELTNSFDIIRGIKQGCTL